MQSKRELNELQSRLDKVRVVIEERYYLSEGDRLESSGPAYKKIMLDTDFERVQESFSRFHQKLADKYPNNPDVKRVFYEYQRLQKRINPEEHTGEEDNDEEAPEEPDELEILATQEWLDKEGI